mmetsp:Transcript_534/g.1540  ORF Transcript_534/g.1540 Transcript_534/m.1540 type:complete len:493 (-) Transcript_534:7-1485(-)
MHGSRRLRRVRDGVAGLHPQTLFGSRSEGPLGGRVAARRRRGRVRRGRGARRGDRAPFGGSRRLVSTVLRGHRRARRPRVRAFAQAARRVPAAPPLGDRQGVARGVRLDEDALERSGLGAFDSRSRPRGARQPRLPLARRREAPRRRAHYGRVGQRRLWTRRGAAAGHFGRMPRRVSLAGRRTRSSGRGHRATRDEVPQARGPRGRRPHGPDARLREGVPRGVPRDHPLFKSNLPAPRAPGAVRPGRVAERAAAARGRVLQRRGAAHPGRAEDRSSRVRRGRRGRAHRGAPRGVLEAVLRRAGVRAGPPRARTVLPGAWLIERAAAVPALATAHGRQGVRVPRGGAVAGRAVPTARAVPRRGRRRQRCALRRRAGVPRGTAEAPRRGGRGGRGRADGHGPRRRARQRAVRPAAPEASGARARPRERAAAVRRRVRRLRRWDVRAEPREAREQAQRRARAEGVPRADRRRARGRRGETRGRAVIGGARRHIFF